MITTATLLRVGILGSLLVPCASGQIFSVNGAGGLIPAAGSGGTGAGWPTALPGSPFVSTVSVPVAVNDLCKVSIEGLNHSWSGDLQIVLIDPAGAGYNLLSRPGYDSAGTFGNDGVFVGGGATVFVRPGAAPIPDGPSVDIPPGIYQQHFGDPNGLTWPNGTGNIQNVTLPNIAGPAGIWTLRIYDWAAADVGSCSGWTLAGNGNCFPPPPPPPPVGYCTAKVNSLGCTPTIGFSGVPSATAGFGFVVDSTNTRNRKPGILLYGITGRCAILFQGGTLCVQSPVKRTGGLDSGGSAAPADDCTGAFQIDMNAFAIQTSPPLPLPELQVPGTLVDCQFWARDPGFAFPDNSSLSAGLEYTILP